MAIFAFSVAEVIRYNFYQLKLMGLMEKGGDSNPLAILFGFLRYNAFIPLYPIGITGELAAYYKAYKFEPHEIYYIIPVIYLIFFP